MRQSCRRLLLRGNNENSTNMSLRSIKVNEIGEYRNNDTRECNVVM